MYIVHNSLIVSRESFTDDGVCQCVLLTIDSLNTVVASIYRPPGTKLSSFKKVFAFIQDYLDNSGNCDVYITGDFNFPNIDWETLNISSELIINGILSAQALLDLMLSQVVEKPKRVNKILDLVLTNRSQYVADIESTKTRLSDHNIACVQHKLKPVQDGTFFVVKFI